MIPLMSMLMSLTSLRFYVLPFFSFFDLCLYLGS